MKFTYKTLFIAVLSTLAFNANADFKKKVDPKAATVKPAVAAPAAVAPAPVMATLPAAPAAVEIKTPQGTVIVHDEESAVDPAVQAANDKALATIKAEKRAKAAADAANAQKRADAAQVEAKKHAAAKEAAAKEKRVLDWLSANPQNPYQCGEAEAWSRIKVEYPERTKAPASVKKEVNKQFAACTAEVNAARAKIAKTNAKQTPEPVQEATPTSQADGVNDTKKSAGDFLVKFASDFKNNGVKEKSCSSGETEMHTNGC